MQHVKSQQLLTISQPQSITHNNHFLSFYTQLTFMDLTTISSLEQEPLGLAKAGLFTHQMLLLLPT